MVRRDLDGADFGGKNMRIDRAKPKPAREDREERRGGHYDDDRRGGHSSSYDRYDDRRSSSYEDRRGGGGGYEDRRGYSAPGGYDRPPYEERRGGGGGSGYEDRKSYGYEDRRDYRESRGGYDRSRYDDRSRDSRPRGGAGSRHPPPHSTDFGMVVDGIPRGADWRDLKDHFRSVGNVCYANVNEQGQGIVQYENEEILLAALKAFDGTSFRGTTITVSRATPSRAATSSSGGDLQRSPSPRRAPESPNGAN